MVHQVIQRPRLYHYLFSKDRSFPVPRYGHPIEYACELLYLFASGLFVAGCLFFLPAWDNTAYGCWCFDVGSAIFFLLSCSDVLEGMILRRWREQQKKQHAKKKVKKVHANEIFEKLLYLVGSLIFAVGSWLYDPTWQPWIESQKWGRGRTSTDLEFWATVLFATGSLIFAFAAFVNALSLHEAHPEFVGWALAVVGCFEIGGLLFCTGSIAFLPNMGCSKEMAVVGTAMYLVGSVAYVAGSFFSLSMRIGLSKLQKRQVKETQEQASLMLQSVMAKAIADVEKKRKEEAHKTAEVVIGDVVGKVFADMEATKRRKSNLMQEIVGRKHRFVKEEEYFDAQGEDEDEDEQARDDEQSEDPGLFSVLFDSFDWFRRVQVAAREPLLR